MPRIFVSHASADDAAVDALSDWLTGAGHDDHFVDHRHLEGGQSWDAALRREAARAEMLILYVTAAWLASEDCFAEYRASFYGDKTVLPLLVGALRAGDLDGDARRRFETMCASVQGIAIDAVPPSGFVAEQIDTAVTRVARAARATRRQRALAYGGVAAIALLTTVLGLAVTNAAYLGERLAKWSVDRSFTLATRLDQPFRDCDSADVCPDMIPLPAARYAIGHADGLDPVEDPALAAEAPIKPVDVPAFSVSRFEVTKAQWRACAVSSRHEEGGCRDLVYSDDIADEPVESISWNDAQAYISWINARLGVEGGGVYRLLSEAEWEYAARGGAKPRTAYSWGPGLGMRPDAKAGLACDHANMLNAAMPVELDVRRRGLDCSGAREPNHVMLAPVGRYAPNAFGLHDTAGNVSEWVADCWHDSHAGRPTGIGAGPWVTGVPVPCDRVIKGGSWIGFVDLLRPAARVGLSPEVRGFNIGFRVARNLPQ